MLALLHALWAWFMAPAIEDVSGCSKGGLCRHMQACKRANCPGHPQNNVQRSEEDGVPCTWRDCWGLYLFLVGLAIVEIGAIIVWLTT